MAQSRPPVAIGGLGGSGTRLIAGLLMELGFDLGPDLNESNDCLLFSLFFKRSELWPPGEHAEEIAYCYSLFRRALRCPGSWSEQELTFTEQLAGQTRPFLPEGWLEERQQVFKNRQSFTESDRWGWKEPNTHIFLPELINLEPGLRYIHVMRHGLDMAFSGNRQQLAYWGEGFLGSAPGEGPEPAFRYWCEANRRAVACGKSMGDAFYLLNYDSFCAEPRRGLEDLFAFLGESPTDDVVLRLLSMIKVPESMGRHKQQDLGFVREEDRELLRSLGFEVAP